MYEGFPPRDPPPEPGEGRWHYLLAALVAAAIMWGLLSSMQPTGGSDPQSFSTPNPP